MADGARPSSGVRVRTTATAVGVVGVVLAVAAAGSVVYVQYTLTDQVRDVALARRDEVAELLRAGPTDPSASAEEALPTNDEEFAQILSDGRVVAATANVEGRAPVDAPADEDGAVVDGVVPGEGAFLVVSTSVAGATLVFGRSLDDVAEATTAATVSLAVAVPIVLAVVGMLTWLLVGRALRPIDEMRAEAERISATQLHRRLPEGGADEVGRLSRTLNGMLARLEAAQRRQRRFVSDSSHELRSPIASIRQHLEVAREDDDRGGRELANRTLPEVDRLQGLVADLLLLASIDEGIQPTAEEVDVDDLVLAEAERLRTGTDLHIDTTRVGAGRVIGVQRQLAKVLRNLADNAARHAETTVAFGVTAADGRVIVTVDDDGPGIPPEERARAQERFVRLDEGRARGEGGSGLGLSIVRAVVVAHGGRLELDASTLGGLRVTVSLPGADDVQRGIRPGSARSKRSTEGGTR